LKVAAARSINFFLSFVGVVIIRKRIKPATAIENVEEEKSFWRAAANNVGGRSGKTIIYQVSRVRRRRRTLAAAALTPCPVLPKTFFAPKGKGCCGVE
jgi:hypothetical protein